ncbi:MAG: SDR family NAD(P)-dependent oxidoreductase [Bacteroidota bacterium]
MEQKYYTLVTGGSQGIGKALALECASRGMNLIIVALENEHLTNTTQEIAQQYPNLKIDKLGIDLSKENAALEVFEWCKSKQYEVNVLINNAGFGRSGWFEQLPLAMYQTMIRLNNQALFEMCYHFMPMLKANTPAHIMNMSSLEAYLPTPYKAAYTATKHFVFAYSLALKEELKPFDVHVSVLTPGSTLTNEDGLKRIQSQGRKAKLVVMMPDAVAKIAIDDLMKKKHIIIPGNVNKFIAFIARNLPIKTKMRLLEKIFRSYVNE